MKPKLKEEVLANHNILVQKYQTMKFEVKLFIKLSTDILKDEAYKSLLKEEDFLFHEYRDYMITLLNMLEKTTDYVGEMMSNVQTARNILTSDEISFSNILSENKILNSPFDGTNPFKTTNIHSESLMNGQIAKRPKIPCGTVDTSIFLIGSIIPCASICSRDPNGLTFYIFINDTPESELLSQLYNKKAYPIYTSYPEQDVVFGMKMEDGIVRAVRCVPLSSKKVYLPDFGDIVDMENNLNKIYHLSEEEQNIPGQAIQCQLYNLNNSTSYSKEQNDFLDTPLYEKMSFKVQNVLDGVLHLSPHQVNIEVPKINNGNRKTTQLTAEEQDILDEEPMSTTNALKAVLGYVPQDDLRICQHYDPITDSCFKGRHCRQEHIQMPSDYFTKDKMPANVFAEKPSMASIIYPQNEVLEVQVTHIKSLEYFYGIIVDPKMPTLEPLLWVDNDIDESDFLKALPINYDIVLAKFSDQNWYRAQVVDTYEATKEVFVFYLDYGNRQIVPLKNIAKCSHSIAEVPARAQLFRLSDLHIIKNQENEILTRGLSTLNNLLINQLIKVCVVSHHEDLVVRLLEKPYCELPKILEEMNCVERIKMY